MKRTHQLAPATVSRRLTALTISLALFCLGVGALASPLTCTQRIAAGVPVNVIRVDLSASGVLVTPAISRGGIGKTESFSSFIRRLKPAAAINGTYYHTWNNRPVGQIVINGKLVNSERRGTALAITWRKRARIITVGPKGLTDWRRYRSVLCAGPRLLTGGRVTLHARAEGFKDPALFSPAIRTAAGIAGSTRLVLVTTRKERTLRQLAIAMRTLGCTDALVLDGGGASAMYFRGKMLTRPRLQMTNVLLVFAIRRSR